MNPEIKLQKGDFINFIIKSQGAPIVNGGYVYEIGENIVGLAVDLKSKHCEATCSYVSSEGNCGIYINAREESLHLNEKVKKDEPTEIEFTDFSGWDVFSCNISRYTLRICLTRKKIKP